ncbi:thioesterase domain-containing protein [Streptomyces sp. CA-142005]|uniref:thioesterase domain-containing protein n=1 Tax=Streptomyces sp. CA-142005 TaxID=3240052 RepID=UPI003D8FD154
MSSDKPPAWRFEAIRRHRPVLRDSLSRFVRCRLEPCAASRHSGVSRGDKCLRSPRRFAASIDDMAADYLRQIRAVQPHGPYQLLGWSSGGAVAHAIARLPRDRGDEVHLLAMLDTTVPGPDYTDPDAGVLVQALRARLSAADC